MAIYNKGYNCCGTVRKGHKEFPEDKIITKVSRGYMEYRSNGQLIVVAWFDRHSVYFLSTMHRAECDEPITIKRKNPDQLDVECPRLLPDYQQYMRGVDRGNQLIGYYNIGRTSVKWWKRFFAHLIECTLLNTYVLHGQAFPHLHSAKGHRRVHFLAFQCVVATELLSSFSSSNKIAGPGADLGFIRGGG